MLRVNPVLFGVKACGRVPTLNIPGLGAPTLNPETSMPVLISMTLSRRMALTYTLVLALTLAVLYSGYAALNAVVAQAP